jgi:hypothetical protein
MEVGVDLGYVAFDYPENNTGLDFEEIVLGLSMGDLGLTFAMGQDGAPDYTEISYAFGPVGFHMVNMMITVITLVFHMVSHVVHMTADLPIQIFQTKDMVLMKMHLYSQYLQVFNF